MEKKEKGKTTDRKNIEIPMVLAYLPRDNIGNDVKKRNLWFNIKFQK